jgi:hypothetical protein
LDLPFALVAVVLPPILLVSAVPISIAGYGIREGAYVLLLRHAGVDATSATLLSLLTGINFAIASLPGGVALLFRSKATSASPRSAQAEDREQKRGEEDLHAGDENGGGDERDLALAERAGAAGEPSADNDDSAD